MYIFVLKKKLTKYHILKLVLYNLNKTKVGQSQKSLIYFEQSESTVAESYVQHSLCLRWS